MKIYLFLPDRVYTFLLPKDIFGSYSFDFNEDEESKLINVEARDSKWVLYSTNDVSIINNNMVIDSILLQTNSFYSIKRGSSTYLIYVEDTKTNNLLVYQYGSNLNLVIGNTNKCNVKYDFGISEEIEINVFRQGENLFLKKIKGVVYVNEIAVVQNVNLKIGDLVTIYGFKLTFLVNIILINYFSSNIPLIDVQSGIVKYTFPDDDEPVNVNIKDIELYNEKDYYSKSPRIRRFIEPKTIKLVAPPDNSENEEMPLILTIGPMVTMGATSIVTIFNILSRSSSNNTPISEQIPTLIISIAMLASMLVWPLITRVYNKHVKANKEKNAIKKYNNYLNEKKEELTNEENLQRDIINENLLTVTQCIEILNHRKINFWDKRIDQNDFLVTRIGVGDQKLNVNIEYPEGGFKIEENELKKKVDNLINEFQYIKNTSVSYSFYENLITAIMGNDIKTVNFINNVILQLITFYTYEDLKLVMFTNKNNEHNWDYIKYLNHCFDDEKTIRFFATDSDSSKEVLDYLNFELNKRIVQNEKNKISKPHYLIIIDDYSNVKRHDFIKKLTEHDTNYGFNLIIRENLFKNLPSKCNNFITLNDGKSGILRNTFEKQEQISFNDEIVYNINMMAIAKILANIPIEFEDGSGHLPDSISFLEMEKVGKVEQLNILNRWNTNDSTTSLRAEIGINEQGELMYLDLHEKYHGPHGLIAGTTGSGKSEFIITYILSMCINYSPDDVSFILIDYKGGGLALAFENRNLGVRLPHLAGTITNLDRAEMDRTLVSIDSEIKRRQRLFNDARDKLGDSTIDIYKYQQHFHDGKLDEPIPHLFIVCDEFAELKSQQPEFMDNLISVARIGRSLGLHLILATQKPSGVVNDQIWSNTRFRVCLKVQDESDSKEMLKNSDAAHIKQVGRFYLQVGYDEYYALGQSGWCGAKYYPSNRIIKQVDKSINFINDCGKFIKSSQSSSDSKGQAKGEQLGNILSNIVEVAKTSKKQARRLWLDNIAEIIYEDNIEKKYNLSSIPYSIDAVIGEYDAPELQEQGIVTYNLLRDGNTIVYGNDSIEREMFLDTLIYSVTKNHSPQEFNFYILDFGSEALRKYEKLPHLAGYVTINEANRINNLFNIISNEQSKRRRMFANYGGEYSKYIVSNSNKLPLLMVIINNLDTFNDNYEDIIYNVLPDATRDSDRYGIVYVMTAIGNNSVRTSIYQNFKNFFAYKLNDTFDYQMLFGRKKNILPREILGRGIFDNGDLHEFQTCYVTNHDNNYNYINAFVSKNREFYSNYRTYLPLPVLPYRVRFDDIKNYITDLTKVPLGISVDEVEVQYINLLSNTGIVISASKKEDTVPFAKSLVTLLNCFKNINLIIIDANQELKFNNQQFKNYYIDNFKEALENLKKHVNMLISNINNQNGVLVINGVEQLCQNIDDDILLEQLFLTLKKYEKICTVFIESNSKLKPYSSSTWYRNIISSGNGVWIGKDCNNQSAIMCDFNQLLNEKIKNDKGFVIVDNNPIMCKILDFYTDDENI